MSNDIMTSFLDLVTDTSATAKYPVGTRRFENGREYVYQQADDAITVNQAVKLDAAASASGLKVTPTAAVGDSCYGVAETAIADEYYGWITVNGVASVLVANGTAADDPLGATAAAGVLGKQAESDSAADFKFVVGNALEANSSGSAAAKNAFIKCR
jgi:hypothetical protein